MTWMVTASKASDRLCKQIPDRQMLTQGPPDLDALIIGTEAMVLWTGEVGIGDSTIHWLVYRMRG